MYTLTLLSCTGYELLYTAQDNYMIYTLYTDYELQSALLEVLFRFSTIRDRIGVKFGVKLGLVDCPISL